MTSMGFTPEGDAPHISLDIEWYVAERKERYELALEGGLPETEDVIESLDKELEDIDDKEIPPDDPVYYEAILAGVASLILRDLKTHMRVLGEGVSNLPETTQHEIGEQSRIYSGVLGTGLQTIEWLDKLDEVPEWPSEAHAISGAVAYQLMHNFNGKDAVAGLSQELLEHADDLAPGH